MIIVPELKTVVILVPRTGSGSLYRAVLARWSKAMMLYRHMEADGVPLGYERWDKVGVVRNPVDRLWSLYNYIKRVVASPERADYTYQSDVLAALKSSIELDFDAWIRFNDIVFPLVYRSVAGAPGTFDPFYWGMKAVPENRKSQFDYLRPDLGTQVFRYERESSARCLLLSTLSREPRT